MATYTKLNSHFTAFATDPFNEARSHVLGLNGRLSGFDPTGNGGDVGTPGLTNPNAGTYIVNVTLSAIPTDEKVGSASNKSYAVANGVLLEMTGTETVRVSKNGLSTPTPANPLVIYAQFTSDPDTSVTYDIALQNTVLLSPANKVILCYYSTESSDWVVSQQISIKGLIDSITAVTQSHGGFTTKKAGDFAISVSPGTIITTNGRVLCSVVKQFAISEPTTPSWYRQDLVVVVDKEEDGADGDILIIKGSEAAAQEDALVPSVTSPLQIPISSVIVQEGAGIVEVVDRKPDLAWQTNIPSNKNPSFTGSASFTDAQPSVVLGNDWAVAAFQTEDPNVADADKESKIVIGKVGSTLSLSITGPASPGNFTPVETTDAYVVKKLTRMLAQTSGGEYIDVTTDGLYGPEGISGGAPIYFDHLLGKFYADETGADAVTSQISYQKFVLEYRIVEPLIAFADDGTRIDRMGLDFYDHVSPDSSDAHTASNITYLNENKILSLPNGTRPLQESVDAIAVKAFGTTTTGGGTQSTNIPSTFFMSFGLSEMKNTYTASPDVRPTNRVTLVPYGGSTNVVIPADLGDSPFLTAPKKFTITNITFSIASRFVGTGLPTATTLFGTQAEVKLWKNKTTSFFSEIFEVAASGSSTVITVSGSGSASVPSQVIDEGVPLQITLEFPNGSIALTGSLTQSFVNANCMLTVTSV